MSSQILSGYYPDQPYLLTAIGGRCCVNLSRLQGRFTYEEALSQLAHCAICPIEIDVCQLALELANTGTFKLTVPTNKPPELVDSSILIQWLYRQIGISLPRHTPGIRDCLPKVNIEEDDLCKDLELGDLVFTLGRSPWRLNETIPEGVGHVGIYVGDQQVVHAAYKRGIVVDQFSRFVEDGKGYRGTRRVIPSWEDFTTLETPPDLDVTSVYDVLCYMFQRRTAINQY